MYKAIVNTATLSILFLYTNFPVTNSVVSAHVTYCYSEMSASKTCKLNFVQR